MRCLVLVLPVISSRTRLLRIGTLQPTGYNANMVWLELYAAAKVWLHVKF